MSKYKDALIDMVWQFAFRGAKNQKLILHTGGLSALEGAFNVLNWSDPYFVPMTKGRKCDYPKCFEWATCGTPTPDGYKHFCGKHFAMEV